VGYQLHTTRAEHWTDAESTPIRLDEWLTLVSADPEMRLDGAAEAATPDGVLRYENRGLAVWIAYSAHEVGGNMAWFDYRRKRIVVKNPDDEIREKMKSLAAKLGAHVIGMRASSISGGHAARNSVCPTRARQRA
jgi:hypothetical protein